MALLYVDLLGTQVRFDRGISVAREGIHALERLVIETLEASSFDDGVRGATETDSVALQFDHAAEAIAFGIELFQRGLAADMKSGDPLWLRGIILRSSLTLHPRRVLDARWPEGERVWSSGSGPRTVQGGPSARRRMERRLRYAARDRLELAQARRTEAVFDRCEEIARRAARRAAR